MSTSIKRDFSALASAFVSIDADRSMILHEALSLFGDAPTYDAYMAARVCIIAGYKAKKPAANDAACDTFFSRFMAAVKAYAAENEYAIALPSKPKADTEAATKKAAQREKAKIEKSDSLKAAELALSTTKAIEKEKAQASATAAKEKRDAFVAFFKALPDVERELFYALRDKRFGVVLQAMPESEIQAGLKAQQALAKLAGKTKAKA
jgi:hypothetical protein